MESIGTFGEALARHASRQPERIALDFEGRTTRYGELDEQATRIANALTALGGRKGSRIAYLGKNCDMAVALTLGVARAGMVFVPIIWRLAGPEITHILEDCGAIALFVEPEFADRVAMTGDIPVIVMNEANFAAWRDAAPSTPVSTAVDIDDVLLQLYTSGTTGRPKGVMLTHGNGTRIRSLQRDAGVPWLVPPEPENTLIAMPYGHIAGVGSTLFAIFDGATIILLREYESGLVLDTIERHRIRRLLLVPAAIKILIEHPKAATTDFSSLDYLFYGASPIPLDLLRQAMAVLECGFVQLYGMTETFGCATALPPHDHGDDRLEAMRSAGKAAPGIEIGIVDDDGAFLPPGRIGEIAVRSPTVMRGYWNREEETARTLIGDGWLRTGDAGLLDADGYLHIQDRVKDMIVSGGENVYPAEVENAIYGHPDVADVAVIGVPDERWGEAVKAVIVPRPGASPDPASIIAFARTRIADFKCPKSIDLIDILPRNASGKILRRILREPYWTGRERMIN